jgi:hypothetical protein
MDTARKIVTQVPLTELWNGSGPLTASRGESLGQTDIAQLIQDGSSFVIADVGLPLRWISENDRYAFWNTEVKCRLVAPNADSFCLDDYPGSYCYVATIWRCTSTAPVIVLEKYH